MAKPQNFVADHALIFDYPKVKKVKNFKHAFDAYALSSGNPSASCFWRGAAVF